MIAIRIKEARLEYEKRTGKKLSTERLAEIVMFDHDSSLASKVDLLNKMQRGAITHPRLDLLERIAATCGVDFNFLLHSELIEFLIEGKPAKN